MRKFILTFAAVLAAVVAVSSCQKSDPATVYYGIVTVKTASDGACRVQLDENTVLIPTNESLKTNPFKKEVRALTSFTYGDIVNEIGGTTFRNATFYQLDSILTKTLAPNLGPANDSIYGTAPIELYNDWLTLVEDGYLSIHFAARWTGRGIPHTINVVKDIYEDELVLELRQNYNGDPVESENWYVAAGYAAFNIRELLDPDKESYKIVLKYKGFENDKTITFDYTPGVSALATEVQTSAKSETKGFLN